MAASPKRKNPPKVKDPNAPKKVKISASGKSVLNSTKEGSNIYDLSGLNIPLSRISTEQPEDSRAFTESLRQMYDPTSESFAGRRTEEESGVLDKLKADAATAGDRSDQMKEIISIMHEGLAGLNASENQALREQGQKEIDRRQAAAAEGINDFARTGGMRGGRQAAALRNSRRDAMGAQGDLESKNLVANVDVQDRRRAQYGDTVAGAERDEFGRKQLASDSYTNTLMDILGGQRDRAQNATVNYGNSLDSKNKYFLDTTKVNLGQERTEAAAKSAGTTGFAGLIETERQRRRDKKRRGGQSNNTRTESGPGYTAEQYLNEAKGIYGNAGAI